MAGTITATTIQNDTSSPPTFRNNSVEIGTLCRAWVNFNGTGTVSIRASFNVSSITDVGTGTYTVNMTNALPDTNYSVTGLCRVAGFGGLVLLVDDVFPRTTTAFRVVTLNAGTSDADAVQVNLAVFR
jgi:hypothetical protein